ncbi:MAG: efflux RND transporter periplasmic adaptor subunit, partial [Saccharofermentanaceae bacterium]
KLYVDYNSHVKKGQLLAELDKRALTMNLQNAEASYENAKAEVTYQTSNYNRMKALWDKKLVAESDYDLALYNYTKANASLKNATSDYEKAKVNLEYAYIYSPIDGVILKRSVDEGQTVAASFSTPTLFSIANDLTQMQVEASIDEADIGQIKYGQQVTFTVDAFSDLNFTGKVTEIRLQPTTTNNVVTYTVIIIAPNPDMKLMPGMTASITITVEEAKNVLCVPSKVLRFKPDSALLLSYLKTQPSAGNAGSKVKSTGDAGGPGDQVYAEIWVKQGTDIHPVRAQIGINDDINAQVISGLKEGEEVIVSMRLSGQSDASGNETAV